MSKTQHNMFRVVKEVGFPIVVAGLLLGNLIIMNQGMLEQQRTNTVLLTKMEVSIKNIAQATDRILMCKAR